MYSKATARLILEFVEDGNMDAYETLDELLMFLDDVTINKFWNNIGDNLYRDRYRTEIEEEEDPDQADLFYVIDPRRV